MKWPKHITMHVTHNQHIGFNQTIEEYLNEGYMNPGDLHPQDRDKIITNNCIWEVNWCSEANINSNETYDVVAATFDRCMEIINSKVWE